MPKGATQKVHTMYRHLRIYGKHSDSVYEEISKEFDPRYKTQPFDRPRFRRVDLVDGTSIHSKAAAPASIQNQIAGPSNARDEPQDILVESSGAGSAVEESTLGRSEPPRSPPGSSSSDVDEMDMDDFNITNDNWVFNLMNEDAEGYGDDAPDQDKPMEFELPEVDPVFANSEIADAEVAAVAVGPASEVHPVFNRPRFNFPEPRPHRMHKNALKRLTCICAGVL